MISAPYRVSWTRKALPFLLLALCCLLCENTFAQDAAAAAAKPKDKTLWDYFLLGGLTMWPLLLCSLAAVFIVIYELLMLKRDKFAPLGLRQELLGHMQACRVRSAIEASAASPSFLGRMMAQALPNVDATDENLGREAVEDAMAVFTQKEGRKEISLLNWLSVIAQVAPMLGLLGTVSGMIGAFATMESREAPKAADLAGDISEALITTYAGLCIAIPTVAAFFWLRNRLAKYVSEATDAGEQCLDSAINTVKAGEQLSKVPEGLAS